MQKTWTNTWSYSMYEIFVNDWIDNELDLAWLKKLFHLETAYLSDRRLLIIDDHASHVFVEFVKFCWQMNIVSLCLSSHTTHYLQSRDVDCFVSLDRAYRKKLKERNKTNVIHIVMLLYWWIKMIDCLLIDLSTAGELKVYIVIRITQCSLAIEMRAILIYLYCMWNALSIWSIRWFRKRSFRKQSRTMTNKCLSESEDDHYQLIREQKVTNLQISLKKIHRSAIASLWDDFSHFYQFIQSYFEWKNIRVDCESSNMSR